MADPGGLIREARTQAGLTQHELARRAGTSQAAVARYEHGSVSPSVSTLERLLQAAGRRLELTAGAGAPTDLSGERAALLRRHRMDIIRLGREVGVSNVRVFGSVARGDDDASSDIDLLVDFDVSAGLMPIVRLTRELERLLGQRVDVAPQELLKPRVRARALAEAVPL